MVSGYKLTEATERDLDEVLSFAIGIVSGTMLQILYDKKYLRTVGDKKALDIIEICKSIARIAVSKEAKEEDQDLIHAVGTLMSVAMHLKSLKDGSPLELSRLDKT